MNSHSQAGQDLFAWEMTEHKTDGTFLDLGCNDATFHSNTYGLEQIGWSGLLVDIVGGCESRKATFIKCDASNPNDRLKLHYSQLPAVVDYLSCDCDNATVQALNALPWDKVTFRVATIETDVYRKGPRDRDNIRTMMRALGYTLVCGDVVVEWPEGTFVPYEDWWCHPQLVNPDLIRRFRCDNKHWKEILSIQ